MAYQLINCFLIHHNQPEINRYQIEQVYRLAKSNRGNWSISLKNNRTLTGKSKKIIILPE